ncbi:MAG: tRNA lysidine(34) synthetase TilS [Treponema sp.]|nr:tRNA lysidine(34) synthetase TilS [Treponema sp.]
MKKSLFEVEVKKNLLACGINPQQQQNIAVAVSGGADSIALLTSIVNIFSGQTVKVITVNHNIRKKKETEGDVRFVISYCEKLNRMGKKVECVFEAVERGKIKEISNELKCGTEDAARRTRYELFEKFIKEHKTDYLCLAHNYNDQLETALMRFLQGSSSEGSSGIPMKRGKYIRPLLTISRSDIEQYLKAQKIKWRNDSTNKKNQFLRNRIRNKLIPFLDKNFTGWNKSVYGAIKKSEEESQIINDVVNAIPLKMENDCAVIAREDFSSSSDGIKKRLLLKACNLAGSESRIPSVFLDDVIKCSDKECMKHFSNLDIILKKEKIFVKKSEKEHTDLFFSDIIEDNREYLFPFGTLECISAGDGKSDFFINGEFSGFRCELPVLVRNCSTDDYIQTSDGKMKKIADIYSNWHVSENERQYIPVIQEIKTKEQRIICILAKQSGFYNWIV